jgi:hypothetical protein
MEEMGVQVILLTLEIQTTAMEGMVAVLIPK